MANPLKNSRGQALLFVIMILLLLSLVCTAGLKLMQNERLTMKGSQEEIQAYYLADAAMEKVCAILKDNVGVLDRFTLNRTYGKFELDSLQKALSGKDAVTLQAIRGLINLPYATLEVTREKGGSFTPVENSQAGIIQTIQLTKTSASDNTYQIRIEVTGKYGPARRSLVTNIRVTAPLNQYRGITVQNSPQLTNDCTIHTPMFILNSVVFQPTGCFYNNVYIKGNCTLQQGSRLTTGNLQVMGNVTLDAGAQITGELMANGHVFLNGDVHGGPVRSSGSVTVDQGHVGYPVTLENGDTEWNGDIYAAGSITPEVSDQFGTAFPQQSQAIINSFLEYPLVDSTWFAKNCDFFYTSDQNLRAEELAQGIHYVMGNVTLTGHYQGNLTLVASGNVTIPAGATLQAKNQQTDSLMIISTGSVQVENQAQLEALVYTGQTMQLANQAQLTGTIICKDFICDGAVVFNQPLLNTIHPAWITTNIEILSWQEKYPVFKMN
ncbi:hypothetical protein Dred_1028 [Desulforamulus reducens MI-1]|uniref:Type 4 fimbrial biogenesis protein PilX N-terminal domain-containing protein n=1 Tax=Desulforamulus reducens (strain ATCC BAA-1160 / DSM 100696 / MI-1) TaxID=349161 RepID=A4J3B0_DESRM|nr:pilus assembly PilX N-terminal domain-containing protein [Desulforamulus reducens]ABO49563.1 hypothetical protein Dred_1028 [Desulforamulus reducens MI-1]